MKRLFYFLCPALLLVGCNTEPKVPRWDVDVVAPLVEGKITINDLVESSTIEVDSNGLVHLVYQQSISDLRPNEIISPLNKEFDNTLLLQNIDLGSPSVKEQFSLGYLAKGGSQAGQFIIFNNGQKTVIPSFSVTRAKKIGIDATSLFQTIELDSGELSLNITNNLPVALVGLDITLSNTNSGAVIMQKLLDTLHSGASYQETFSLAGKTIEGNLTAAIPVFATPGSGTDTVLIDTSQTIDIQLSLNKLKPKSATAIFPDQNLAQDTADAEIKVNQAQLTGIEVKEGSIFIEGTSTIADEISLQYLIPNATKASVPLQFLESIPAASSPAPGYAHTTFDLTGYSVDLTGRPDYVNIYNTFYTILIGKIDSSGQMVHLSLDDSVRIKTGIQNLTASKGYGFLGKDTMDAQELNEIDIFRFLDKGLFDLAEVELGIDIENKIGAPIDLQLHEMVSQSSSGNVSLAWAGLGQNQLVPAAQLNANNTIIPGFLNLPLNESNSNLDALLENKPEFFESSLSAYVNGSTQSPDYNQFIFFEDGISASLSLSIPLILSASNLQMQDSSKFEYHKIDPNNQLQSGTLKLHADNSFPLDCEIEIVLLDATGIAIDSLQSAETALGAAVDINGNSIEIKESTLNFPLQKTKVSSLRACKQMVFKVSVSSVTPPQKVRIRQSDCLAIRLSGDLTIQNK